MVKKLSVNNEGITVKSEWGKGSVFSFTLENRKDENDDDVPLEIEDNHLVVEVSDRSLSNTSSDLP
jgi:hypothetical protein